MLFALVLLAACTGATTDTDKDLDSATDTGDTAAPIDEDQDGFPVDEDCDDADATVSPGAAEVPWDDVDNDCAGGDDRGWLDVAAIGAVACGVDRAGAARCWGDVEARGLEDIQPGPFTQIAVGDDVACALDPVGAPTCWGDGSAELSADWFVNVDAAGAHVCGARFDGSVECSFDLTPDTRVVPGTYMHAAAGVSYACGLDPEGAITCWNAGIYGPSDYGQAVAPSGVYVAMDAGPSHACAIDTSGALSCWGLSLDGRTTPPAGTFSSVSVGGEHACAIGDEGVVTCWGSNAYGQASPPVGTFASVSAGNNVSCGLLADGGVVCWGSNITGQLDVPE